ncbi:MAG: immunoglobulin-like domain-containing protein, partial [Cellvibrionaceae bacterium]
MSTLVKGFQAVLSLSRLQITLHILSLSFIFNPILSLVKSIQVRPVLLVLMSLVLISCGGGGGGDDDGDNNGGGNIATTPAVETLELGTPSAKPAVLPLSGELSSVTFISVVSGTAYPDRLFLDEVDQDGNVIATNVAQLLDDGNGADVHLGDRVFTGTLTIGSVDAVEKRYQVSADNAGDTVSSSSSTLWVSGCPVRARPSNAQQLVADRLPSEALIFANEVLVTVANDVAPDLDLLTDIINPAGENLNARVVGCIPALRQYLIEIEGDGTAEGVYTAIDALWINPENPADTTGDSRVASATVNAQVLDLPASEAFDCDGQECQWYLERIRAQQAWALGGAGDEQQGVAVIDFGVDCNHPELDCDGAIYNQDLIDHGTGVAGLIGANNLDNTDFAGVAWNTTLYPYNFLGQGGSQYKMSELITLSLAEDNVKVINISAVTAIDPNQQIHEAICGAIGSGRLVVAAAGNATQGQSCSVENVYPAAYNTTSNSNLQCSNGADIQSGLLVVGATDINNGLAEWDNNSLCSNTRHVDIFAPGKDIYTASVGNSYAAKSGTSYAAPLVAGSAAVLWSAEPGFSPQQIHDRLTGASSTLSASAATERIRTIDDRVDGQPILDLFLALGGQDSLPQPDTDPDPITFATQTGVARGQLITSDTVTITGIDNRTPIDITNGFYAIDDQPFTSAAGAIENGQNLRIQVLSPTTPERTRTVQITVGGETASFSIETEAADTRPDSFDFIDSDNAPLNTAVSSNILAIPGINTDTPISIEGGTYAVGDGNFTETDFTAVAGTVSEGQSIQLRVTTPSSPESAVTATVTIGGVTDSYTVTTEDIDTEVNPFAFQPVLDLPLNTEQTSNAISVSEINTDANISISGGEYAIGETGPFQFTDEAGTVRAGDVVRIRQTSAATSETDTYSTLTVGDFSATYRLRTQFVDTLAPVITLNGANPLTLNQGDTYNEAGATAIDGVDGTVTVNISGAIDTNTVGVYSITYTATDSAGNTSTTTRTVNVVLPADITPPVITLNGASTITLVLGSNYNDAGATATDDRDGSVAVSSTGVVNTSAQGTYTITYSASDAAGNSSTATRTVIVTLPADTTPPAITLNGASSVSVTEGNAYLEPGATAIDARDGSVAVNISGNVNTNVVGTYSVTYTAADAAGNTATTTRTVNVVAEVVPDTIPPVITLNGSASITLTQGDSYTDAGATANDNEDGAVAVSSSGVVNTSTAGTYTITYTASDAAGNTSTAIRTIIVNLPPDTTPPVITLNGAASITLTEGDSYTDAGATAIDARDGAVAVSSSGSVNTNAAGTYIITYTATDAAGNTATATRTVIVNLPPDTTPPTITVTGASSVTIAEGDSYTDAGAT